MKHPFSHKQLRVMDRKIAIELRLEQRDILRTLRDHGVTDEDINKLLLIEMRNMGRKEPAESF